MGCGCGGFGAGGAQVFQPYKFSFTHTQFQAAALTSSIDAFTLGAKFVLGGFMFRPTIQFAGPGFTSYGIALGLAGDVQRYSLYFDVLTVAPGGTVHSQGWPFEMVNFTASTLIKISAFSAGANLNVSTAGALDLYVWLAAYP